jgi:two-component system, chemotaxis family, sensor kinase CheA
LPGVAEMDTASRINIGDMAARIRTVRATDLEALAAIGLALEQAATATPASEKALVETLQRSLVQLQAVYLGQTPDAAGALGAMADALVAAAPAPAAACPSLDDAMALLLSLDPNSPKTAAPLQQALGRLGEETSLSAGAREAIKQAAETLGAFIQGTAADPAGALARVAELLESASGETATASAPATVAETSVPRPAATPAPSAPARATAAGSPAPAATNPTVFDKPAMLPADADLEILKEYIVESLDHVGMAETALLTLETDPTQSEPVHTVFRAFHTIKGTSGFLGLDRIQRLAHLAESLLDRVREGQIRLAGGYADLALESCDNLKSMIQGLAGLQPEAPLPVPETYNDLMIRLNNPEAAGVGEDSNLPARPRVGDILVAEGKATREQVEAAVAVQQGERVGEVLVQAGEVKAPEVAKALRLQKQIAGDDKSDASIRVATHRLDALINMVGELVISHSMIAHDPDVMGGGGARLSRNVNRTGKIVRELQDLTMALRMVPLRATFQKMARLVRDVARKSDKAVQFVTEGDDTEIDRNMVEALNDPLVHMIRNAVDHGIEQADARQATGKNPTGTVTLRAFHSAGNVVIELVDDGKGLDKDRIRAKAIERQLIGADDTLSDAEIFNLIFLPGFSTAEKVTDVSGRGVGMDVVRRQVESLQGRVEIASQPGRGSTFSVRLPLTMAITDAMVLRVGRERYLLPMISIVQSFRPTADSISSVVGRGEMVLLRGDLIPVFRLYQMFGVAEAVNDPCLGLFVVMETHGRRCALLVDELLGQQQVVIKTLGRGMGQVPGVAGGAILGDGRVGLILDAGGLERLAQCRQDSHEIVAAADATANL